MGGPGSGRKRSENRKQVVEKSFTIDLRKLIDEGLLDRDYSNGHIEWRSDGFIDYNLVKQSTDTYLLNLKYERFMNDENHHLDYSILIHPIKTQYGKIGDIFQCPLSIDGVKCTRNALHLYLPNNSLYFGCRDCHDLTYRFCQEYHNDDDGGLKQEAEMQRMEMTGHLNQSNEIVILNRN